jgi:hypothetical protein
MSPTSAKAAELRAHLRRHSKQADSDNQRRGMQWAKFSARHIQDHDEVIRCEYCTFTHATSSNEMRI